MGDLAGILNIFGFVAVIAIVIASFLLIYYGIIDLNRLKSMLVFISRKGIFLTPNGVEQMMGPQFTGKELILLIELRDEHQIGRDGKRYGPKYHLYNDEQDDTKNIGLFRAKYVEDKKD